jgi:hypothetical protein
MGKKKIGEKVWCREMGRRKKQLRNDKGKTGGERTHNEGRRERRRGMGRGGMI